VVGAVGGALILLGAPSERTTNTGSRAHASLGFGPASVGVVGKW
jgi:hypothetical protein